MKLFAAVALGALVLSAAPALAQSKVVQGQDSTVFKKKTVIDFSDVTLEGELTKPEGAYGLSRGKTKFNSLIKLRTHFTPEMNKSTDQL